MKVAYLSLQAVEQGQDSWAAVEEIVEEWEQAGWQVDRWFVHYDRPDHRPGVPERIRHMLSLQRRLVRELERYDVLYVRGHPMAWPIVDAAHKRGIPVIHECHGTYEDLFVAWPAAKIARPLFEWMQRDQYRRADLIFCGTEPQRRWLESEAQRNDIVLSPNGANSEVFHPDAPRRADLPERYAVFFGQFAPWQGIESLIEARGREEWPDDVTLVFVGDGVLRDVVGDAASSAPGRIVSLGRLPYQEVPGVVAHAVASFCPQFTPERGETGFSALKLYESMSCGVPVIGSDYPGVSDVIRAYDCGIVVEPGNAEALARAVGYLLDNPVQAALMGARGRDAIERDGSWRARARQRREAVGSMLEKRRTVR